MTTVAKPARIAETARLPRLLERKSQILLLLPAVIFVIGLFAIPLLMMVRMSFNLTEPRPYGSGLTLESYVRLFTDPLYLRMIWRTVRLATVITAISAIIGIPYAYLIWRSRGLRRNLLLAAALLPLFTNVIARIYAWQILLSRGGPINSLLIDLGIIDQPLALTGSFVGATIGLTYVALPYFIVIYLSSLSGVDWSLVEAARTLGSGRIRSLFEVVLPITAPGLAIAASVAFAWGMGAYAETLTLGSPREWGLGYEAWRQWMQGRNWPLSTSLSVVMVTMTLLAVLFFLRQGRSLGRTAE